MLEEKILHSFEAGRRGKPDELDANIAHLIGAHLLEINPESRFDLRVSGDYSSEFDKIILRIGGEVSRSLISSPDLNSDVAKIAVDYYNNVHRNSLKQDNFIFDFNFKPQADALASNGHAGDSGNPIAVAYRNSPSYLPWERYISVCIRDFLDACTVSDGINSPFCKVVKSPDFLTGLKADGKVYVSALYNGSQLHSINDIVIHAEHEDSLDLEKLRSQIGNFVSLFLEAEQKFQARHKNNYVNLSAPKIKVNSLGPWNSGGWKVDAGSREAKSYRDGFATYGVNEDSFSGEDPSKPSATGTMLSRYIAVQVVGNNLADFARVALEYSIGKGEVGLNITTNGTGRISQDELNGWVRENIPLRINDAISLFGLKNPTLYRQIAQSSDFFHNPEFPWNNVEIAYKKTTHKLPRFV